MGFYPVFKILLWVFTSRLKFHFFLVVLWMLKPILRTCCATVHKGAIIFLVKKQTQKKQVHSQEVVPVCISVPKKQVSWLCSQNLFGSGTGFCGGEQGKGTRVEVWSDHQVKTRMVRDECSFKN